MIAFPLSKPTKQNGAFSKESTASPSPKKAPVMVSPLIASIRMKAPGGASPRLSTRHASARRFGADGNRVLKPTRERRKDEASSDTHMANICSQKLNMFQHIFLWRPSYWVLVGKCFRAPYAQRQQLLTTLLTWQLLRRLAQIAVSSIRKQKISKTSPTRLFVNWSQLGCQRDRMDLFTN